MICLLKIPTTNFLVTRRASYCQQQKLFHRNHRNFLLLCHPLQTNNAQCSILSLKDVTNRKLILNQSRGLRHNVGGTETKDDKEDKDSSSTTTTKNDNGAKKMNAEQLESKFKLKFSEFMIEFREDVKAGNAKMSDFRFTKKQFVDKFNEEHAKSGYKIEELENNNQKIAPFVVFLPFFVLTILIWVLRPRGSVKPEHAQIVAAQPPITFDQFIHDYLSSGEIDIIFHYPAQNLMVALLHPGAIINGEPFTGPGVNVQLDESFHYFPMTLSQRVREEERRIGVREAVPIAIRQVEFSSLLFYMMGTFFLSMFIGSQFGRFIIKYFRNRMYCAVPINPKKGEVTKTPPKD